MFLGIDIGTSAVKASVMDADGAVRASGTGPLDISNPHPGWSEQAPDDWWTATVTAVKAALTGDVDAGAIRALGLSGQMHGAVLLDADHAVLRPAILWNDGRSAEDCARFERAHPELSAIAGVRPMPGFTAPKLLWLAREEPDIFARIANILLPKDFVGLKLHGQRVTDPSDAAGTSWFDQNARAWSPALCHAFGIEADWLPRVLDGHEIAGELTREAAEALGLAPGLPVAAGAGDAAAGAVSVGAVAPGAGFLSLGTSGQLFLPMDRFATAPELGLHSYAHTLPGLWFQMAAMLNGARPMSWFAGIAGQDVGALLASAETARHAPLFLPYLTGERTPHGDAAIRGAFYGLSDDTGAGEMMRGVLEAIAFSFRDARDAVAETGPLPDTILAIGGGTRSDLLLQTIADVMEMEIARGEGAEIGPALGAARLAAVAAGAMDLSDLAQRPEITARFAPRADATAALSSRLEAYRALYTALKPVRDML